MSSGILTQSIKISCTDFLAKGVYQMKINLAGDTRNVSLLSISISSAIKFIDMKKILPLSHSCFYYAVL